MTQQRHPALDPAARVPGDVLQRRTDRVQPVAVDFEDVARGLAHWYLEFQAGRRAVDQVQTMVTAAVFQRLRQQADVRHPAPAVDPIVRTIVQRASADRIEAVVLARRLDRVIAVTIALVHHKGDLGWRVVELSTPLDDDRARTRARQWSRDPDTNENELVSQPLHGTS